MDGFTVESPSDNVHNTARALICFEAASKLVMGTTFFLSRRVPVSEKEVELLSPDTISHHRVRREAS